MANLDFRTSGFLGGMVAAEEAQREEVKFGLDVQAAQQNLFAKSLEIQDYIDNEEYRKTKRRTDIEKMESEERLLPQSEKTSMALMQAQEKKASLTADAMRLEEMSRPLFHITPDNYNEQIKLIPDDIKEANGLTGKGWAEDGSRIIMAREASVNSAAHMRAMELAGIRAAGKGGSSKATAINVAKKNQETIHTMLSNDNIYNSLDAGSQASYRSSITALAMDMYQQNVDRIRNGSKEDLIPFTNWVDRVKTVADKHVTGEDSMWSRFVNNREFNREAFAADVSATLGLSVPREITDELEAKPDVPSEMQQPSASIPPAVQAGIQKARSHIDTVRAQQGIGSNISDHVIFNKLVEQGFLNPDGSKYVNTKEPTFKYTPAGDRARQAYQAGIDKVVKKINDRVRREYFDDTTKNELQFALEHGDWNSQEERMLKRAIRSK